MAGPQQNLISSGWQYEITFSYKGTIFPLKTVSSFSPKRSASVQNIHAVGSKPAIGTGSNSIENDFSLSLQIGELDTMTSVFDIPSVFEFDDGSASITIFNKQNGVTKTYYGITFSSDDYTVERQSIETLINLSGKFTTQI